MTTDYGTDLDLRDLDMAPDGGTVTGRALLEQVALIRLSTPRGTCLECEDDGVCLTDWLSRAMGPSEVASLAAVLEAELLKDERIRAARAIVDASSLPSAGELTVELELDGGEGPFRLVLGASAAGIAILGGA
jgi:hypothetical protein